MRSASSNTGNPHLHGDELLRRAAAAFQAGDAAAARRLLLTLLQEDPENLRAWKLTYRLCRTPQDRRRCLERILELDPHNDAAQQALGTLRAEDLPAPTLADPPGESDSRLSLSDLLFLPVGLLLNLPAGVLFVGLVLLLLLGGFGLFRSDASFFGMEGPDFDALTISSNYEEIASGDVYWKVTFEFDRTSRFAGLVRYTGPIRERNLQILTHDVLITSGEYADPAIVSTRVSNHHFFWRSENTAHPQGTINLLHTVPANEEIYRQLSEIRDGDQVVVTGREILDVKIYDQSGKYLGNWHDTGCNTLVVDSVTILSE